MNLADMRAMVRRDLRDEDSDDYRWTNDELDRHIAHAVKEFSEYIPYEQKATKSTVSGSREIDISTVTNRVMVEAVEYPAGQFPRRYQPFSLWGDTLTLIGEEVPDGSNTCIYYGKIHTLDTESSTIPPWLEELISAGAAGYAAVEWAAYSINRVNTGGTATGGEFLDWGQRRLKHFHHELKRMGRRNRARVNSLYKPHYPVNSKSIDYGP